MILTVGDDVGDLRRDLLMAPGAGVDLVGRGDPAHFPRAVPAALGALESRGEGLDAEFRARFTVRALPFTPRHQLSAAAHPPTEPTRACPPPRRRSPRRDR